MKKKLFIIAGLVAAVVFASRRAAKTDRGQLAVAKAQTAAAKVKETTAPVASSAAAKVGTVTATAREKAAELRKPTTDA